MEGVLMYIRQHISWYAVILILLSSYMLLFSDRSQLAGAGLKKEAKFSLTAGIIYLIAAFSVIIINAFVPQ